MHERGLWQVAQSAPVKAAKTKIQDKKEDIQETWETSQNPCVGVEHNIASARWTRTLR